MFIIPFRAATISGPFISLGIPAQWGSLLSVQLSRRPKISFTISNVESGISIGFPLIIFSWRGAQLIEGVN